MRELIITNISFESIIPPAVAMRLETDKSNIKELASSVDKVGLIQPITVVKVGKYYEVVAGFRRYLAIKLLKWNAVPVLIVDVEREQMLSIMTAENYEREEVNTFDEAVYLKKLLDTG